MAGDDSPFDDLNGSRDYGRVLVALVCLLAVVLAASVVPALSPQGTAMPAESLVPLPQGQLGGGTGASLDGAGSGGLGALSPGSETRVGGDLGGENALQSQSTEVHFTVRSTSPAYWRTGAYDTYTGEGWRDDGESEPYDGSVPVEGLEGETVHYEVELERTARSLPTVWRPAEVSRENASVTSERAIKAERPLSAGTAYAGVSDRPPQDPDLLRTAGRDYPAAIEDRYTQLPESTDGRLSPFTDRITENASSPYETAVRVEDWLEANKEYNLSVSEPPAGDVATQFIFEMDEGYCEYFATSMVTMLRSQDIPARYVVGYSTGQPTGENTYEVRGMNAHAWVEVYFPEVGWVTFDPTPSTERQQAEQESLETEGVTTATPEPSPTPTPETAPAETATADADDTERRSVTETSTPPTEAGDTVEGTPLETESGERRTATEDADQREESTYEERHRQAGEYNVVLNRSAVAGAPVTVTVRQASRPAEDVTVSFNGEAVGRTDASGQVEAEIPYADRLEVTVDDGENEVPAVGGAPAAGPELSAVQGPRANSTTTFDLGTNATVSVTGDAVTGNDVVVTATVDDVPVREATVSVDGEAVATTDRRGRADVALPTTPGNVTIEVARESVSGSATLSLPALNVTVEPAAPLALPYTGARVNVTMDGEPVPGANVTRDGDPVGATEVDGTATASLPLSENATFAVAAHGQRGSATVGGLYANLGIVGGALALLLGAVAVAGRRAGVGPRDVPGWLHRAGQTLVAVLVAVGRGADRLVAAAIARVRATADHLRALIEGRRSLSDLLAALREWIESREEAVRSPVAAGIEAGESLVGADDAGDADAQTTVREGWERFLDRVSLRRPAVHTPGEIATHAVEADGLPADAVGTVVEAFRAVEYGKRDPDDRAPEVERAVEAIERALSADSDAADSEVAD